jgi:hypothetical protein
MIKILLVAAPLVIFGTVAHLPIAPVKPDFDWTLGQFSCLGDICRTKAGMLPVSWRRYGKYKDRSTWKWD